MLLHVLMTVRGKFVFTSENQRKIMITCDYIMCSFVDKIWFYISCIVHLMDTKLVKIINKLCVGFYIYILM